MYSTTGAISSSTSRVTALAAGVYWEDRERRSLTGVRSTRRTRSRSSSVLGRQGHLSTEAPPIKEIAPGSRDLAPQDTACYSNHGDIVSTGESSVHFRGFCEWNPDPGRVCLGLADGRCLLRDLRTSRT